MAENVVIESSANKPYSKKVVSLVSPIIVFLVSVVGSKLAKFISHKYEDKMGEHCYFKNFIWNTDCSVCREYKLKSDFWEQVANILKKFSPALAVITALCAAGIVAYTVMYFYRRKTKITVTNKRLYGYAAFGKEVDLPLREISDVSTGRFKSISVSTQSDKHVFPGLEDRDGLHNRINQYLENQKGGSAPRYFEQENNNVANNFLHFFDNDEEKQDKRDIDNKKQLY